MSFIPIPDNTIESINKAFKRLHQDIGIAVNTVQQAQPQISQPIQPKTTVVVGSSSTQTQGIQDKTTQPGATTPSSVIDMVGFTPTVIAYPSGQIFVDWSQWAGFSDKSLNYNVYSSWDSSCPVVDGNIVGKSLSAGNFTMTNLTISFKYYIRVRAQRNNEIGLPSEIANATIPISAGQDGHVTVMSTSYYSLPVGTWGFTQDSGSVTNGSLNNSATHANGDSAIYKLTLAAETYTLVIYHETGSSRGILDVLIDGVSIGTIDCYSGGPVYNVRSAIGPFTISSPGLKTVTLKVNGKNASSSNYYMYLNYFVFFQSVAISTQLIDNCDSAVPWSVISGTGTLALNTTSKIEGTGCIEINVPGLQTITVQSLFSAIDISSQLNIKIFLARSAVSGYPLATIYFGETNYNEQSKSSLVLTSDWVEYAWDISGIAAASRNAVTKFAVYIYNASVDNLVVYIDFIRATA